MPVYVVMIRSRGDAAFDLDLNGVVRKELKRAFPVHDCYVATSWEWVLPSVISNALNIVDCPAPFTLDRIEKDRAAILIWLSRNLDFIEARLSRAEGRLH